MAVDGFIAAGSSVVSAPNAGMRAPISAWLTCDARDSIVITTEMPTDEPMLRTRLKRPAASVRWCGSSVA